MGTPNRIFVLLLLVCSANAKGKQAKVICDDNMMTVTVPLDTENERIYLDQLKGYKVCAPRIENGAATFSLNLNDVHECGVTRLLYKPTGKKVYYHKVVIENDDSREVITVRCSLGPVEQLNVHNVHRREVDLPAGFYEPEDLNITTIITGMAPEPRLRVTVSQNGKEVSGEISVTPGTPLTMKVFLDKEAASVYGLMVNQLHVSDTVAQQETIVFNGCSVDPYLFDNFITQDGDLLEAKFKAFKFPDTTYVQFRGTVVVCLNKCDGTQCNNGVIGYGRKRRSIQGSSENKRLFEISLTTFIKVGDDNKEANDITKLLRSLKVANQMLDHDNNHTAEVLTATVQEKPQNIGVTYENNSASKSSTSFIIGLFSCVTLLTFKYL